MLKHMHSGIVTAGVAALLAATVQGGEIRTAAAAPAGARVCVVNVNSAEQSCDGETPLKLQVMKFASDNLDNRRRESLLSSALSAYVAQGFRIVGCLESGKEPVCIVARDSR